MKKNRHRRVRFKLIAAAASIVLLLGGSIGGSLAWVVDNTEDVTNTFTASKISIDLKEDNGTAITKSFQMVPGKALDKDPKVKVSADSEDCYVFIAVQEKNNALKSDSTEKYILYNIDTTYWTQVPVTPGVYYRVIKTDADKNVDIPILAGGTNTYQSITWTWTANQVLVNPLVLESDMNAVYTNSADQPQLIFTAYAAQYLKNNDTEFSGLI